jgi:8-oxo-dGTP pyrophosphatase MutT (NUDIX family)
MIYEGIMKVVYAGEEMPEEFTKSIFLAGPTPRNKKEVESWRPDALKLLEDIGFDGVVFVPEPREVKENHVYEDQVEWEEEYLNVADCIVFWVPRDLTPDSTGFPKMAAFTTNVEWGAWADSGKVVLGCPEDAEKVTYLKYYADKYNVPVGETLTETLDLALEKLGDGAERSGGERYVPLFLWNTDSFQSWYQSQKEAGNRLDRARLLYTFRPRFKNFLFLWILKVEVWIESEQRSKTNEFVLARTDISSVLLYHSPKDSQGSCLEYEVVLVKEFRSPARTEDGFVRELPGGSSVKDTSPEVTAADEIHEETGFYIEPDRLKFVDARQLSGTLSSHQAHLFKAELTEKEIEWFKSQDGIVHGNVEDTERTFIEVVSIDNLIHSKTVDWSTLGMILATLAY